VVHDTDQQTAGCKTGKNSMPGPPLHHKKQHNANNAEPVGNQLARALPGAMRRQRIRLIDGDEIDSVWF